MATHNNISDQGLGPHIGRKRKLSWDSRAFDRAERVAALASLVQTGKMRGVGLRELGLRALGGQPDPFGAGLPR